jgi:RNA polymerase sigma-70 factor (ECF subfamily)
MNVVMSDGIRPIRSLRFMAGGTLALDYGARIDKPDATPAERVGELVDAHFDFIWRLLRRLGVPEPEVDDASQQVFMIAARRIDAIEPGCERTFLYGAALRTASNVKRTQRRRREEIFDHLDDVPSPASAPDDAVTTRRARELLDTVLARMPLELRLVFVLSQIEELTSPEIAAMQGIPLGTVSSRLRRARDIFRRELDAIGATNPFGGES